jgi:Zn-dependent protease/CBS domain-containing protein
MRWSFRIARVGGVDLYVHATFLILIAAFLFAFLWQGQTPLAALGGVLSLVLLFGCVVLHELGHAMVARRFGIRTRDITLLPIGGIARLERIPTEPRQELLVALAGPAVNLAIAGVVWGLLTVLGRSPAGLVHGGILDNLFWVNVSLCLFNLLPAFPMDGGRVLRALLATRLDYAHASEIAARIGQGMAFLFGLFGLFTNPMLLFIALFIYLGAEQEASLARVRSATQGLPVRFGMVTRYQTIAPDDTLGRVAQLLLAGCQHDFPVVEGDQLLGLLTRTDLLQHLARSGAETTARQALRPVKLQLEEEEMLDEALRRMQESGETSVPVFRHGRLVGLLTAENIGELLMVQAALRGGRPPRALPPEPAYGASRT